MADKDRTTTGNRDSRGRFVAGNQVSRGRPHGASNRALRMARDAAENVALPKLIELAQHGDRKSCEILVAYGLPRIKPVELPEPIQLPEYTSRAAFLDGLLNMVRRGELTLDAAARAMSMVDGTPETNTEIKLPDIQITFVDPDGSRYKCDEEGNRITLNTEQNDLPE